MKQIILTIFLLLLLFIEGCSDSNNFKDLPTPTNTNCDKCFITVPPLTIFSPIYLSPLIEVFDESGKIIGSRYYFNSWEPSTVEIECGKKIRVDVAFWEVCYAYPGQPIYARLWQGRGFFSPLDCNFTIDLNKLEWISGSCILYPFQ